MSFRRVMWWPSFPKWRVAEEMQRLRGSQRLTREVIDVSAVLEAVQDPGAGAVALFLGTVRDNDDGAGVESIEYEAYGPMAEKQLALIEEELRRKWPATKGVCIVHRAGKLTIGEVSVAIAVSSPHRADAFEACRYVIEAIKHDVPIWKREKMADGTAVWVEGNPLSGGGSTPGKTSPVAGSRRRKTKAGRNRRANN
jgi:molybdopterin synthase catalytic subunit